MRELLVSIQNILVGNSSSLYQWEMLSETFVLPPTTEGKKEFIVVDGKDDSLMRRYCIPDQTTLGSFLLTMLLATQNASW
jgi:hypothetical protein